MPGAESAQQTAGPLDLAQRVAKKIRSRGARGIVGLSKAFKVMDDNNSDDLSAEEFSKAMRDYRISDNDEEIHAIIQIFDRDGSG